MVDFTRDGHRLTMLVTGITGKNPPYYGDENSHRTVETVFLSNLEMCGGFWNSIDSIDHDPLG